MNRSIQVKKSNDNQVDNWIKWCSVLALAFIVYNVVKVIFS
jgi:hypothetical protein